MASVKYYLLGIVLPAVVAWYSYGTMEVIGRTGTGYVAKAVCSGVFVANRSAESVFENDLASLARRLISYQVNHDLKSVRASTYLGILYSDAVYHSRYTGCSVIADRAEYESAHRARFEQLSDADKRSRQQQQLQDNEMEKTGGDESETHPLQYLNRAVQDVVDAQFTRAAYDASHARAIVVLHRGHLVAEGYATEYMPDMDQSTGNLGWSMSKALLSILIGMRIRHGHLALDQVVHGDNVTLANILQMMDVLPIHEDYSETGDIPKLLFQSPSIMRSIENYDRSTGRQPGGRGTWYYSSALTNVLSDVLRRTFATHADYWRFPREALFDIIGADSFVIETDQSGLYVASSFSYATARDWAKLGQLLVQRGVWKGKRLLDESYVNFMWQRAEGSADTYGAQIWCIPEKPMAADTPLYVQRERVSVEYLQRASPPPGTCWMAGHEGQFVLMSPSVDLVVVRLGRTPGMVAPRDPALWDNWHPPWNVSHFYAQILKGIDS